MRRPVLLLIALVACTAATGPSVLHLSRGPTKKAVTSVSVVPDSMTIYVDDTARAVCVPRNQSGVPLANTCTWTAADSTVLRFYTIGAQAAGIIALAAGQRTVTVTVKGTAVQTALAVTVIDTTPAPPPPPTLTGLTIAPKSASVQTSGSKAFTSASTWSDGQPHADTVAWAATGGTVSATGLYTAGLSAGAFRVVASELGRADTAAVTVTAPPPPPPPADSCARHVAVSTTAQFTAALGAALPGDCIDLAAGTYASASWTMSRSGTAQSPIVIHGPRTAVLDFGGTGKPALTGSYVQMRGFRLTNFTTVGFWLTGAHDNVLDSLEIDHTKQEAVAFKTGSHHNTIKNSLIHDTGIADAHYGEAVYVGVSTGDATVIGNQILNNHLGPNVRADMVDVKGGSDSTVIRGNYMDGTGSVYQSDGSHVSLIVVAGNHVLIENDTLIYGVPHGIYFYGAFAGKGGLVQNTLIHLYGLTGYAYARGVKVDAGFSPQVVVKCSTVVDNIPAGGAAYQGVTCTP